MRKLLSVLSSTLQGGVRGGLLFLALLTTTTLWAYDFQYGELYYYITSSSEPYTVEVYDANLSITTVIIPETVTYEGTTYSVTSIGDDAFERCSSLTIVTIPNSVTSIGESAFWGCESLTSITIPNSVTSIGNHAFYYCSALTSVTIPNNVTSIEYNAFYGCSALTSVIIPNSVTSIERQAFSGCSSLTSMVVENGNSTYDSRENCNAIIETATNTLIAGCQNTIIPNSVTSIGESAFDGCESLTSITIPNSVTSIGERAFYGCDALTSVTIGNSVTSIGFWAFYGCNARLTSIIVESGNSTYDSRENCNAIIETATNTLIAGCQNTIIPNSVTSIGDGAFEGCDALTSITIPNSVTSIGYGAFRNCSNLTSVTIGNSVTSIGERAFAFCESLTSITIPNSVTSIGRQAFAWCSSRKTVICEAIEVPELDDYVFDDMPLSEATLYVPAQSLDDYKAAEQWKEFGTILPIEGESEEEIELQDTEMTIVFTNSEDNDSEIYRQTLTIKVPIAPTIAGFTFLYWQPVAEPITNEITIQAIYEANVPSSAPEVYVNPANPVQKLLRNGQVYILQDGKTYTITGQKL